MSTTLRSCHDVVVASPVYSHRQWLNINCRVLQGVVEFDVNSQSLRLFRDGRFFARDAKHSANCTVCSSVRSTVCRTPVCVKTSKRVSEILSPPSRLVTLILSETVAFRNSEILTKPPATCGVWKSAIFRLKLTTFMWRTGHQYRHLSITTRTKIKLGN